MGVDLDTYRARIGSFISRRNVKCDDEKRTISILKERFRLKIGLKAIDSWNPRVLERATINASSNFRKCTQGLDVHVSTKLPMSLLSPKSAHCARHSSRTVAMFILTLLVSYQLIKQLLTLSGNVEMNPGPLGQQDPTFTLKNITSALKPVAEWRALAVQLDISGTKIEEIDVNNRGQVAECKHDMVQFWLECDTSCSWMKLVDALNTCDESVLAEKIKSTYCPLHEGTILSIYNDTSLAAATLPSTQSVKGCNKYIQDLKYRYRNHKPAQGDFPPVGTFSYVNLALIKGTTNTHNDEFFYNTIQGDVVETKVTISYHDLFSSITPDNRILLIEGRPGCGKTTLTRKLSKDWGEETILDFVKYLFLIPLRHFNKKAPIKLQTILEHFKMTDLELTIEETRGESVCFVFDGLDEYIKPYSTDENCWFEQALRGEVLTCSTIVITSRPNASVELMKTVHLRGEVLGFLTKQIDECIVKSYPDSSTKAEELQTYLNSHPNIKHMCFVPFNLVMIIFMFDNHNNKTTPLPETETDVYRQFTIISLIRYFRKENRKIELRDLESLPSPEISMFQIISKLAYTTVVTSKTSITQEELRPMCEESSIASLANLGILVVDENEEEYGASHVLTFVHLTHQEFLAAYYASRLSSGEQLKSIREDFVKPHMEVVLKFFCGITKLQNPDQWAAIMDILLTDKDGEKMPVTLRALHCVFESQSGQRCRELFSKADGRLQIVSETLTLLDYCVTGYCLESARDTIRSIELQCQLTAEGLDIITKQLTTMENFTNLKIRDDLCQKEKLLALKHLLQKLPNVESLDLERCFRDRARSDWFLLGELLKQTSHLQILSLSHNFIGAEGMESLCTSASHFSSLTSLDLSSNNIGAEGMKSLCTSANNFSSLTSLNLSGNNLGAEGMGSLCTSASHFSSLTSLNLSVNSIGAKGMKSLCTSASHFSSLTSLDLSDNLIGAEGMESLCTSASHFSSLSSLNLGRNDMRAEGMESLCTSASHFSSLTSLDISWNDIGAEGMESLCSSASHFSSLTSLDLSDNRIGAEGMKSLCTSASHFSSLTSLDLSHNLIGAEGMESLCTSASHFSSLTFLNLRLNNLRDDSIESLLLIIKQCPLEELILRDLYDRLYIFSNRFSYEDTQLLIERAKSVRPGIKLVLVDPTTTAKAPRSTTTANPPRSTTTANPPRSTTNANPPRSTTATATPPRSLCLLF